MKFKMLVPIELLNNSFIYPLNRFLSDKVEHRRSLIASNLSQIFKVVFDLLKDVELLEPRFSCTLLQHDSSSCQAYCKGKRLSEWLRTLNQSKTGFWII